MGKNLTVCTSKYRVLKTTNSLRACCPRVCCLQVSDVGSAIMQSCMGCPLLVTLAVAAIRGKARRTVRDNLMVSELVGIWRDVNDNFLRNASLAGVQGAAALTYQLKVQQVYAASIQLAQASCVERSLCEKTFELLMQVLRMLPAGRWIPAAAIKAIMDALTSDSAVRTTASCATDDVLELLEDFSIIMQRKQSVYNPDGVPPTSNPAARRSTSS
jgi:hypothetical protein